MGKDVEGGEADPLTRLTGFLARRCPLERSGRGIMVRGLFDSAARYLNELRRAWLERGKTSFESSPHAPPSLPLAPLERLRLTDGVGRTLFEQYARHRADARGDEETGWLLLGLRQPREAIALATLPAGAMADASISHVQFNSIAQAVGSRFVRQDDRRLTILGVVHTHPGSLRHPSDGDLRGDRVWVRHLRGQEGIFGIGTSDAPKDEALFAIQPRPNVQCLGELRFSWYALRQGESAYRPLPIEVTLGPDLAQNLHPAWPILERHAERLERLCEQQAGSRLEALSSPPGLMVTIPLMGRESVRVLLREEQILYLVEREGEVYEAGIDDELIDRGVYRLLAELAH
jgi:hypothetical protein